MAKKRDQIFVQNTRFRFLSKTQQFAGALVPAQIAPRDALGGADAEEPLGRTDRLVEQPHLGHRRPGGQIRLGLVLGAVVAGGYVDRKCQARHRALGGILDARRRRGVREEVAPVHHVQPVVVVLQRIPNLRRGGRGVAVPVDGCRVQVTHLRRVDQAAQHVQQHGALHLEEIG